MGNELNEFMNKQECIQSIGNYFQDKPVMKAYLFGSILNETFTNQSDIDVMVELDYLNGGNDFFVYLQMQEDLSKLTKRHVDLVSANGISVMVKPYIDKHKELIYDRKG